MRPHCIFVQFNLKIFIQKTLTGAKLFESELVWQFSIVVYFYYYAPANIVR